MNERLNEADDRSDDLSPLQKIEVAEDIEKHLFWKAVLRPLVNVAIAHAYAQLRTCPHDQIERHRAIIEAYEKVLNMPAKVKEKAEQDLKVEQYHRELNGDQEEAQS